MKFCLVGLMTMSELDGKIFTEEVNRLTQWATVMQGTHFNGFAFDLGLYGLPYEFFNEYDLVMVAVRHETIAAGLKIKKQSTARVVVLLDGEMEYFISQLSGHQQVQLIELINIADAVGVSHERDIPIIKTLTTRPVGLLGLPFPLKRVREELCTPVEKKPVIRLGAIHRNGIVNLAALSEIGLPGVVDVWAREDIEYVKQLKNYLPLPPVYFNYTPRWEDYIASLNSCMLGLHLDYRQVWGRFALDCAAVNIPCLAPDNFYTQKILFPRLCVDYQDIDGVVELAKKLMQNNSFNEEVMAYAQSQLAFFDNEAAKKRLFDLLM